MSDAQVVVTGIGLITPFGDKDQTRRGIAAGQSATRWLNGPPPPGTKSRGLYAGAPALFEPRFGEDPVVEIAMQAAEQAVADSGLDFSSIERHRIGCVIGTSKGLLDTYAREFQSNRNAIGRRITRTTTGASFAGSVQPRPPAAVTYPGFRPNTPALRVAQHLDLSGPCLCPVAACATGLQSISRGADLITDGYCDVVLAGSSDASICDWVLSSFNRLGVLAKDFTDPAMAVRPFAEDRDGFVVGEGAAVLVLEPEDRATDRGATPYARWVGSCSAADPTGMTQIDESGQILTELLRRTLVSHGVVPGEIDLLNLHGTATGPNDTCESRAMARLFSDGIPRCSFKSRIGHCLGAAGSVELAISLLNPTWRCMLKTSLGFGGHIQAAILRRT